MNFLESISCSLTANVIAKASRSLREPVSATERGLAVALSTALAAVSTIAAADAGALAQLLRNHTVESAVRDDLDAVFGGDGITPDIRGRGIAAVDDLFGTRTSAIESSLAASAGVRHSSASSLLAVAVPVVLGFLSRYQVRQGLSVAALARVLAWQRDSVMPALPVGISSTIGFSSSIEPAPQVVERVLQPGAATGSAPMRGAVRSLPILGVFAALILTCVLLLPRGRGDTVADKTEVAAIRLPDGAVLRVQPHSFNYNLVKFIERGPAQDLPKTFALDRLDFETESTQLTAESEPTIETLVAILQSRPNTAITLVGHAADSQSTKANDQLALERANSVREILLDEGIDPKRVVAAGDGQDHPIRLSAGEGPRSEGPQLELTVIRK